MKIQRIFFQFSKESGATAPDFSFSSQYDTIAHRKDEVIVNAKVKAIFYMIFSSCSFALMNAFVRLAGDVPSVEKSFFRNLVAAFVALALLLRERKGFAIQKGTLPFHLARSILGTIGILCNFYAVDHLVLSNASVLNKMSPFFVLIFSYFILKEKINLFQGSVVAIAFIGSLFVVQPTLSNLNLGPSIIGLCSGIAAGGAYTMVRILGLKGERSAVIVFFFSAFSCLSVTPWLLFHYQPLTAHQLMMLIGAGVAATGGQFGITLAYTHAPAREVSVYDYFQVIFAAFLGYILFSQVPNRWNVLGYVLIVGSALAIFLYNNQYPPFRPKRKAEGRSEGLT